MQSFSSESTPGVYQVVSSGKTTEVEGDRYSYAEGSGSLQVWDGDVVVAEFRWWDSITLKRD